MSINHPPKPNTDADIIADFLAKGGKITKGKTKPMPRELGISNNTWNNKLTKAEKEEKNGSK